MEKHEEEEDKLFDDISEECKRLQRLNTLQQNVDELEARLKEVNAEFHAHTASSSSATAEKPLVVNRTVERYEEPHYIKRINLLEKEIQSKLHKITLNQVKGAAVERHRRPTRPYYKTNICNEFRKREGGCFYQHSNRGCKMSHECNTDGSGLCDFNFNRIRCPFPYCRFKHDRRIQDQDR